MLGLHSLYCDAMINLRIFGDDETYIEFIDMMNLRLTICSGKAAVAGFALR